MDLEYMGDIRSAVAKREIQWIRCPHDLPDEEYAQYAEYIVRSDLTNEELTKKATLSLHREKGAIWVFYGNLPAFRVSLYQMGYRAMLDVLENWGTIRLTVGSHMYPKWTMSYEELIRYLRSSLTVVRDKEQFQNLVFQLNSRIREELFFQDTMYMRLEKLIWLFDCRADLFIEFGTFMSYFNGPFELDTGEVGIDALKKTVCQRLFSELRG